MSHPSKLLLLLALGACDAPTAAVTPAATPPETGPATDAVLPTPPPSVPSQGPPLPTPDPCDTFTLNAPVGVGVLQSTQLSVTGGIGPFSFSLTNDTSGGAITESSGLWLPGVEPGIDTIRVEDLGCGVTDTAMVEVYEALRAEPDAEIPPGISFDIVMRGGSGAWTCAAVDLVASATLTGCGFTSGGVGDSVVEVTDTQTGLTDQATLRVRDGLTLLDSELHLAFVDQPYRFDFASGSGEADFTPGPGLTLVDGALVATTAGSREVTVLDAITGFSQSVTVVAAAPFVLDPATAPRDGNGRTASQVRVADLDGDGWSEVIAGMSMRDLERDATGLIAVFPGSPSGPTSPPSQLIAGGVDRIELGRDLVVGDFNADGLLDLASASADATVPGQDRRGSVQIRWGQMSGAFESEPGLQIVGTRNADRLGGAVEACDIDGDGIEDLIIGIPGLDDDTGGSTVNATGGVAVHLGSPGGPSADPDALWYADRPSDNAALAEAGSALATGDVDGDGLCDVAVGGYQGDATDPDASRGAVWVVTGADLLANGPSLALIGSNEESDARSELGYAIAMGPVAGSTHDALFIGHPKSAGHEGDFEGGRVLGFSSDQLGSSTDVLNAEDAAWLALGDGARTSAGRSVSVLDGTVYVGAPGVRNGALGTTGAIYAFEPDLAATTTVPLVDEPLLLPEILRAQAGWSVVPLPEGGLVTIASGAFHPDRVPPGIQDGAVVYADEAGALELEVPGDAVGMHVGTSVTHYTPASGPPRVLAGAPDYARTNIDDGAFASWTPDGTVAAGWDAINTPSAANLGSQVRNVGDLDGDGLDEVVVIARQHNRSADLEAPYAVGACPDDVRNRAGALWLWLGSGAGPSGQPDFVIFGADSNERISSVSTALDFDGDGQRGFAIGSPREDRVSIYDGPWIPAPGSIVERCAPERVIQGPNGDFGTRVETLPGSCDRLVVSSPFDSPAGNNRGAIRVFEGCTGAGLSWTGVEGANNNDTLGRAGLAVREGIAGVTVVGSNPLKSDGGLAEVGLVSGTTLPTPLTAPNDAPGNDLSSISGEVRTPTNWTRLGTTSAERLGAAIVFGPDGELIIGATGQGGLVEAWALGGTGPSERLYRTGVGIENTALGSALEVVDRMLVVGVPSSSVAGPDNGAVYAFPLP